MDYKPNISSEGYYLILIKAKYGFYGRSLQSYKKLEPKEFEVVIPNLKKLLTDCIGQHALGNYLFDIFEQDYGKGLDRAFCESLGIADIHPEGRGIFPRTIESTDDVKVLYFAPNGESSVVNVV